jgi:hypothetical protein
MKYLRILIRVSTGFHGVKVRGSIELYISSPHTAGTITWNSECQHCITLVYCHSSLVMSPSKIKINEDSKMQDPSLATPDIMALKMLYGITDSRILKLKIHRLGGRIFTPRLMKIQLFYWVRAPCGLAHRGQSFQEVCCLQHQG